VRLCCQWVTTLELEILPPYVPSPQEAQDPALYAANVRKLYVGGTAPSLLLLLLLLLGICAHGPVRR
jgi:hypothetical protein